MACLSNPWPAPFCKRFANERLATARHASSRRPRRWALKGCKRRTSWDAPTLHAMGVSGLLIRRSWVRVPPAASRSNGYWMIFGLRAHRHAVQVSLQSPPQTPLEQVRSPCRAVGGGPVTATRDVRGIHRADAPLAQTGHDGPRRSGPARVRCLADHARARGHRGQRSASRSHRELQAPPRSGSSHGETTRELLRRCRPR